MVRFFKKYFESVAWAIALLFLYMMNVSSETSFCIFKIIGFESCFGCGIGHSIHYALHLDFDNSFETHLMGIPAAILLILQCLKPFIKIKLQYK